jgi:pyridoxine/pyridoxamine 5'-phosphate oxidase
MLSEADSSGLLDRIWQVLHQATVERQHAWRTPVLATVDSEGAPHARTVVLRHAEPSSGTLHVYTDRRSPKVAQLTARPAGVLVFWCPALSWQLRVRATFIADDHSASMQAVWDQVRHTRAAKDYLSAAAPGEPLPATEWLTSPEPQLAVLIGQVESIDWLEIGRDTHRRALFDHQGTRWLTP